MDQKSKDKKFFITNIIPILLTIFVIFFYIYTNQTGWVLGTIIISIVMTILSYIFSHIFQILSVILLILIVIILSQIRDRIYSIRLDQDEGKDNSKK